MFTQLNPTLPLHVLDRGDGYAVGVIDYGQEHNLIWVTVLNDSGEIWCAPNHLVRFGKNWTMGRSENSHIAKYKGRDPDTVKVPDMCAECTEALAS